MLPARRVAQKHGPRIRAFAQEVLAHLATLGPQQLSARDMPGVLIALATVQVGGRPLLSLRAACWLGK